MQMTIASVLNVQVRNTYFRNGRYYYQRRVPNDLLDKYPSSLIKINLETADPAVAARMVLELNRKYEAEWTLLKADPSSSPQATRAQAERLLAQHGIDPKNPGDELEHFFSRLDEKREKYAGRDEEVYREADPREFLSPVEVAALEIVRHPERDRLSDALTFYLETHHKAGSESLEKASMVAMNGLIATVGDKAIEDLTRDDGRCLVKAELARKMKTGTVRRRLQSLSAILNHYYREKEIDRKNPFEGLKIVGEGEDEEKRQPFSLDELKLLQQKCREKDDAIRWIVAMLADTGARLAEVTGLGLDDIRLDDEVPHIVIASRPWRPLKTKDSERTVPLLGFALWAAKRVKDTAKEGQRFAFPRYFKDGKCSAVTASATISGWLSSAGLNHTAHELRHTMRDRLREVQCPEEIIDAVGGWALRSVGQGYGRGYSLKIKQEWLQKIAAE